MHTLTYGIHTYTGTYTQTSLTVCIQQRCNVLLTRFTQFSVPKSRQIRHTQNLHLHVHMHIHMYVYVCVFVRL